MNGVTLGVFETTFDLFKRANNKKLHLHEPCDFELICYSGNLTVNISAFISSRFNTLNITGKFALTVCDDGKPKTYDEKQALVYVKKQKFEPIHVCRMTAVRCGYLLAMPKVQLLMKFYLRFTGRKLDVVLRDENPCTIKIPELDIGAGGRMFFLVAFKLRINSI